MRPPGAASPSAKSISGRRNSSSSNGRSHEEKFSDNTTIIPEVMDSSTLNFKANLSVHDFFLGGGGPPSPYGCVLVSLCQSLSCVKISGRSTP